MRPPGTHGALYGTLAGAGTGTGGGERWSLRTRASARLAELLPPDVLPPARAILLAEREELSHEWTRRFADAGLAHLLAISGLHVGILAGGALLLAGLAGGPAVRYPLAAGLVGLYVLAIGAPSSALRAALVFGGFAAARVRGSPSRAGDVLGLAACVMLLVDPLSLLRPGFQMSFTGFGGLLLGKEAAGATSRAYRARRRRKGSPGGRWTRRRDRWAVAGLSALGASTGAFLLSAPVVAAHFGRVAPVSILSNLVGTPLLSLALFGLVATLCLPAPGAAPFAEGTAVVLRALFRLADGFARLPLHGSVPEPGVLDWVGFGAVAIGVSYLLASRARRGRGALICGAAVAVWLVGPIVRTGKGRAETLFCTLDVGQGDAAVLRTRRGHWILLDAGPGPGFRPRGRTGYDAGARVVVPFLRRRGARRVDLFLLSHAHLDHLGGVAAVFRSFPVSQVLEPGVAIAEPAYRDFLETVVERGVTWRVGRAGDRVRVDEVEILVLFPDSATAPGRAAPGSRDPNEVSLVVRVRVGERFVYLNTGDAPAEAEAGVLTRWPTDSVHAVVLKVGHHGSRGSASEAWLAATAPRWAVISVGARNRYGHPHPAVLRRLEASGAVRVWRTDRDGTLCLAIRPGDGRWRVVGKGGSESPPASGIFERKARRPRGTGGGEPAPDLSSPEPASRREKPGGF